MENYFQMNMDKRQIDAISNLGLAHIGDGVYELLCRAYLCEKGDQTVLKLHKDTVNLVKAPTQAKFAEKLKPMLTREELRALLRSEAVRQDCWIRRYLCVRSRVRLMI